VFVVLPSTPYPAANTATESLASAGYGQLSYDLLKQLELTLSLRYDRDAQALTDFLSPGPQRSTAFSAWQPKVSMSYKFTDAMVYATAGTGFRSGGFNPPNSGFSDLYPAESTHNIELGVKSTLLEGRMQLNGAIFQNHYDNQQTFILNGANQGIVSIDRSTIRGAELELQLKPLAELQLGITLSHLHSEINDYNGTSLYVGNRVPLTYGFSSTFTAQYSKTVGTGQLILRTDYERHSDNYWFVDNGDKQSPVDLVNGRVGYDIGNWETALWTKNALNKRYTEEFFAKEYLGEPQDIRYPGTPRLYGVTVQYHF
jgi:iron complex outermembrane recepter protein